MSTVHALRRTTILALIAGFAISASALAPAAAQPAKVAGAAAPANPAAADEIPVSRITLYRSGVGFFQREGTLSGNAKVQLRFKTDQVNDILKSLVLLDRDGGRIDAVSYSSKDPLDRRLASFGINIGDNPGANEILSRLRGTAVKLTSPDGELSGTIMNVEKRPTVLSGSPNTPTTVHDLPWINLITPKGVKSVNLTTVTGFEILDKSLAEELNKALAALAEYRAENAKTVDLSFSGQGTRRVVVAYVHEMPVWKTSYRLILPDTGAKAGAKDDKGKSGTPTIHGWAIVENTTDQDWTNVKLALVAGRPVSFQMDLYEPLYTSRPMIPVPTIAGVMPRQYQEGVNANLTEAMARHRDADVERRSYAAKPAAGAEAADASPGRGGAGKSAFRANLAPGEAEKNGLTYYGSPQLELGRVLSADDLSSYAAAAQAQGGTVGEIFQYELETPVTIERQRSAMIPILSSPIQGRRVSIFNLTDRSDHPMRGVELKNTADLQLLPGPIAVFEGSDTTSAYAGDAQIGHIPPGDKRLLAYAVDLDVAVLTKPESTSTITHLKIVDGLLEETVKQQNTVTYGFENKDAKRARTILVEHPRLTDWNLVEPKEAQEKTQGLYRFEIALDPGKTQTLKVLQERTESQRMQVTALDLNAILAYRQQGRLSDAVVDAFKEVASRQAAINDSTRAIAEIDKQTAAISQDQGRIRENMKTIDRQSELYRRYSTKLNDQESELEKLITQRAAAVQQLEDRKADLASYLNKLNVE